MAEKKPLFGPKKPLRLRPRRTSTGDDQDPADKAPASSPPLTFWSKAAIAFLVTAGVVLITGSVALWLIGGSAVVSETSTSATTTAETTGEESPGGTASGAKTPEPTADATPKTSSQDQTTSVEQTTSSDSGDPSDRSDALTAALLGLGSALLLTGAFFPRIAAISFPGGSVTLTPAQVGAALAQAKSGDAADPKADPQAARTDVLNFLDAITPVGLAAEDSFSEAFVSEAVEAYGESSHD